MIKNIPLAEIEQAKATAETIRAGIEAAVKLANANSKQCGWWHDSRLPGEGHLLANEVYAPFVIAAKLLLTITEVAEATEGHRKDLQDDKLTDRSMLEVELADALLRIFDLAGELGLDVAGALLAKTNFNLVRPDHQVINRRAPGGKKY